MPVTLSFGNHQNYTLNESRLAHLLSADKEKAIHMGGWDKVQDHFRAEKKDHALEVLHSIIHGQGRGEPGEMEVNVEDINKIYPLNGYNIWPARLIRICLLSSWTLLRHNFYLWSATR